MVYLASHVVYVWSRDLPVASHVVYLVVVQYFLPLCVISVAYARIMYRVWFSKAPGSALDGRDKIMNKNKKNRTVEPSL